MEQKKKIKIIIIVLAVLLGLSLAALGGTLLYHKLANSTPATVTVPDNLITPDEDTTESSTTQSTAGNASDNGTLTVTPEWGTCAVAGEDTVIENGGEIGTKAAQLSPTDDTAAEPSDAAPQPTAPEDTAPEEETTSAPDAQSAMPESSANEE